MNRIPLATPQMLSSGTGVEVCDARDDAMKNCRWLNNKKHTALKLFDFNKDSLT